MSGMLSDDAMVFSVIANYFAPTDESVWNEITAGGVWSEFLGGVRRLLQEGHVLGQESAPIVRARRCRPLQEFLADEEMCALYTPPSFEEKRSFAARHLVGGLPQSAVPVESLYVSWASDARQGAFPHQKGLYMADTALYMRDLLARMGLETPSAFANCPDHLSVELELLSYLLEEGLTAEAQEFVLERFGWLTDYRLKLVALGSEAFFALALVDIVLGARACLAESRSDKLVAAVDDC